jgi:hypothetical protein
LAGNKEQWFLSSHILHKVRTNFYEKPQGYEKVIKRTKTGVSCEYAELGRVMLG